MITRYCSLLLIALLWATAPANAARPNYNYVGASYVNGEADADDDIIDSDDIDQEGFRIDTSAQLLNDNLWLFASYAKTDDNGTVTEVAEKNPISTNATVGIYYWKAGKNYVTSAEEMIEKNIRVNNEFYVCPVYNQAIEKSQKIIIEEVNEMWGIGTPEDLDNFLMEYNGHI